MMKRTHLLLLVISIALISCKEDLPSSKISGVIIDKYSKDPLANATIQVLENGPSITSESDGSFSFDNSSLIDIEQMDINGSSFAALRIQHEDYRPIEVNIQLNSKTEIGLTDKELPTYYYNQPVQLNDNIPTGPLSESSLDRQTIQLLMENIVQDEYKELHSILVYKDDALVLEDYFFGNNDTIDFENNVIVDKQPEPIQWDRTTPHYMASVNKALTSTLTGIALDQHNLSTLATIKDYLPEYASFFADENKASVTFESCLTMTTGFKWDEWSSNDLALLWKSEDFGDFVLSRENMGTGSEWRYNSAIPNLLLKSIETMTGVNVRDWAQENFYGKLGITNFKWQSQPDGTAEGSARIYLTPRDMLKIGITYLNKGKWKDEQVIPANYVAECFEVKENTISGDYSYYFWIRELNGIKYLSAEGDGGNYINIFPEQNMVIVITQGLYLKWPSYVTQADDIMGNYILPAIE